MPTFVNNIQVAAATGKTLYTVILKPPNQILIPSRGVYEVSTPANWLTYVVALTESVPGSGIYFGTVPFGMGTNVALLPIYQQAGASPDPTDTLLDAENGTTGGLTLVLDYDASLGVKSIAPLKGSLDSRPIQVPQPQNSAAKAQAILSALYDARLTLASSEIASVTIDGQQVTYTSAQEIDAAILFWERRVALLTGRRRRVRGIRMGHC